ncbi:MAG: CBS domain-containing protein [Candidatus Thorarchaeota archaeon]|nr:MAG: transcriptional regulator [Candidatus Thorarchaeota archaeon]
MKLSPESLKKLRHEVGMTQTDLALEVGVSQSYIARLERGSLDPKLSVANRIVEVLMSRQSRTVSDIMTPDPITINARSTVSEAVALMQLNGFSQLPVVRGLQVVGIVTERDVIRNLRHDLHEISVQAVLDDEGAPMVTEAASVDSIIPLFETYQAVLVHEQGRLRGIITRSDLLKLV